MNEETRNTAVFFVVAMFQLTRFMHYPTGLTDDHATSSGGNLAFHSPDMIPFSIVNSGYDNALELFTRYDDVRYIVVIDQSGLSFAFAACPAPSDGSTGESEIQFVLA